MTQNPRNRIESIESLELRKMRAIRNMRMMPEFADDPRIDAFARELLDELESLNHHQPALFD